MVGKKERWRRVKQTGLSWYVLCLEQEARHRLTGSSKGQKAEGLTPDKCHWGTFPS